MRAPTETELWQAFAASAARRPDAVALDFGTFTVSFRDLSEQARRAAAWLVTLGISPGDVIVIQLPKRATTYALILGCLRLGAIYAPADPRNPAVRTAAMLSRLQPKVLLTCIGTRNPHGQTQIAAVDGSFDFTTWPAPLADASGTPRASTEPAYIMHTSGSTGEPKGAVVPQQGILNLMSWSAGLLGDPDQRRFTALNPLHFDNSVFDTYCGLISGATLVPIETADMPDPAQWVARIQNSKSDVVFSVPTLLLLLDKIGRLTPHHLPDVRTFLFGGEGFPIDALRAVHARFDGAARFVNVYGPTETSCICSSLVLDEVALSTTNSLPSLGRMHADFSHLVLDDQNRPVAFGELGELWIGGPNVGLGYFANPDETARRFIQDPRHSNYRSIYYRSGDLVREDAAGLLWFQGRADNQIKIAGHRVELEDIDGALEAQPGIRRSLTVLSTRSGVPELVSAFETESPVNLSVLTTAIAARLPAYMRPARLIELPKLPLNANGKIDRRAIQALADAPPVTPVNVGTTRDRVRIAWSTVLGHTSFTDTDSFFDLGGTSLALARVHAALNTPVPDIISMLDLFAHPTVAKTVLFLDGALAQPTGSTAIDRARRQQAALARARTRTPGASA